MTTPRGRGIVRRRLTRVVLAAVATALLATAPTAAAPQETGDDAVQRVEVTLQREAHVVDPQGSFELDVVVSVTAPTEYLEVRVRVLRPGGSLLYQKTEIRHDAEPGEVAVPFSREIGDLGLAEGRYPLNVRVLATGSDPTTLEDDMLVLSPDREPLPVAIVARFACSPSVDPEGRFLTDPSLPDETRDAVAEVTRTARGRRDARLTLALPPLLLDEWMRAARGYETTGGAGRTEVEETDDVPLEYAAALADVRDTLQAGRVELLFVPFAEPDLAGLQACDGMEDLREHYRRGISVYQASLGATPVAGTSFLGDSLPEEAVPFVAASGIDFALVGPESVGSAEGTVAPGTYRVRESTLTVIVTDRLAASALTDPRSPEGLVSHLFDAAMESDGPPRPVVALLDLGTGTRTDVAALSEALDVLISEEWLEPVFVSEVPGAGVERPVGLVETADTGGPAPPRYWDEVGEAGRFARAFVASVGENDPETEASMITLLTAESRCWAGSDGSWDQAGRGLAFARASLREAQAVLSAVTITGEDVLLGGRSGKVPLTIHNASEKNIAVTIDVSAVSIELADASVEATLRPLDNYVTIPVDLEPALVDELTFGVRAGDLELASTTLTVRAFYLDRLVVVASVVLVLVLLLFYIRRRVGRARPRPSASGLRDPNDDSERELA